VKIFLFRDSADNVQVFLYVDFTMLDEQRIMDSEDEFEILM